MNTRKPSTTRHSIDFSKEMELYIWNKAFIINGQNPNLIRHDKCGAIIYFTEYGNRSSQYGWEIDHIIPVASNGSDEAINLQPLHWANNASKSDNPDIPNQYCKITGKN